MDEKRKRYVSEAIDVTYSARRCIHAAECVNRLSAVFDVSQRPWIQPGNAAADAVAATIEKCPTGALQYERKDGAGNEAAAARNTITPVVDGPLYIRGQVTIETPTGETLLTDTRLALCRCGASANKPFCDNAHKEAGFRAGASVPANEAQTGDDHAPLTIVPAPDGPLLLRGDFEIISADGRALYHGQKAALCRCGGSMNKPFCDGTHKAIGFSSTDAAEQ